ncbi:sialidase family protein [Gimesia sp.]|uniref:sialidase family protein n=1 Tax=Gimesia sp. TaxID=2024833 RepID=UPI0025C093DC|nr:sialidase family protein [Gimesia sp.]
MKIALTFCFNLFLMVSLVTASEPLVPADWDAALAGDQVLERLIPVTGKQVKGAHDAEMVLVEDRAFIVAEVNDTRAGESAGWPEIYCAMSIVNLKSLKVEAVIPFARSSQKFENETLPVGACFVPRILTHDENTLRCFFASEQPGARQAQTWYIDFDLSSHTFENKIHKLKLKTAAGTFDMQPQFFHADAAARGFRKPAKDFGLYLFDRFKNWDGQTYIAINNFATKQNALARINDQHDTIEVLGHYNEPQSAQLSESAVNRLPDGTWMAICRNDGGNRNYYFTTSQNRRDWTEATPITAVPNGTSSKPTFDRFGDVYYLGWQEATRVEGVNRSVFNIDVSRDGKTWQRKYRFETPRSFQYPAFAEHAGVIWLCVTQGDASPSRKERIMFGKLEETGVFASQAGMQRKPKPEPVVPTAVMQPGVELFTDRQYQLQEVPGLLKGLKFLKTTIEGYTAVCKEAGTLYALTPARRPGAASRELDLIRQGFEKVDLPEFPLFPGEINRVTTWRKQVKQGAHLRFQKLVLLVLGSGTSVEVTEATPESKSEKQAQIQNMERLADLALVPPVVNTSPLPEYDYDKLDYGMTIGIERTPGGRLWACWVAGGDSPKAFFVLASSDDDGAHWSKPRVVLDSHSPDLPIDRSILVGNLWTDPLGRLWLIFDQSLHMFDGRAGVWATICENPDADQPEWSPPRRIWHGVTLNKPTVLASGEWMLPVSLDQRSGFGPFKGCFQELDPLRGANVFVSTDQGATWQRRGAAVFPNPDWHEHMIVERNDGSLWMLARTAKGIMQTTSTDGGRTWATPSQPPQIRQPNARFHIRRLASGRLLLVKHGDRIDAHQGRVQLSAWLSDDDGQTWQGGLVIDERKGISYPDGFQAPDGSIYISYDRNRATDGEILLAKFTEQDILAKKLVSPQSKLKQLISQATHAQKKAKQKPE